MTTPTRTTNPRENHRECPAALPSRGLGSRAAAINLKSAGLMVGQQLLQDIRFRAVALPEGWRGVPAIDLSDHGIDPHWWGHVIDQHGRTRATVQWISEDSTNGQPAWRPLTIVYDVRAYTLAAMQGNQPLIFDQQWATRAAVLTAAQTELDALADRVREYDDQRRTNPHTDAAFPTFVDDVHRFARFVETVKLTREVAR